MAVLKIKDENGNFIDIPAIVGPKGDGADITIIDENSNIIIPITVDYDYTDETVAAAALKFITNRETPTAAELQQWDFNGDGKINISDISRAASIVSLGLTTSTPGRIEVKADNVLSGLALYDGTGTKRTFVGYNTLTVGGENFSNYDTFTLYLADDPWTCWNYTFKKGITWEEWVNSGNNVDGWTFGGYNAGEYKRTINNTSLATNGVYYVPMSNSGTEEDPITNYITSGTYAVEFFSFGGYQQ